MTERLAHCSCGELRAHCTGEPVRISVCHCFACKARTGSAFSVNVTFLADQVRTEGPFQTFVRIAVSGRQNRFRFCPSCGATVFYDIDARPGMISVPVGAFTDPDFPDPTVEVYAERRAPWCNLDPRIAADDR
ncbi:GFA family protein [Lichenifustis flavocetrariae]|uniref:GFA family protein n=1 Tax=Lichenifustis flavocetrariae TaxID=2949735 RepID=A0AA42CKN6_9HYPH|nr:GFA family protein [Lichenifustis flavocetrariae]MCW6509466.1 GFA family protein [Lichenifustis flavocetrariae]